MSMNINAKQGAKVIYCNPNNGQTHDQETARKYLTLGNTYTVLETEVHDWSTDVYLQEFPGVRFNSVMFEDKPKKKRQA